jgi:hypothetical protein
MTHVGVRRIGIAAVGACVLAVAAAGPAGAAGQSFQRAATPFAYVAPKAGSRALFALSRNPDSLVQVDRSAATTALMRRNGGTLVSQALNVWQLRSGVAQELTPQLQRSGALIDAEPTHNLDFFGRLDLPSDLLQGDPLIPEEWWLHAIGADAAGEPPGPGVPVTDVDSGIDVTHPEFATRPNTIAMNPQSVTAEEEWHGTAVSSVAAASANGLGLVGAYPQAVYRMWDASPDGQLTNPDEIQGINAAVAAGPGVINLSIGSESPDTLEKQAVFRAFGSGTLVVAASGNSRTPDSNPLEYPAGYPHVLTVAATRPSDGLSASWSSSSPFVDLAAPGVQIPIAIPTAVDPTGYETADGTSFAAPLVAGAAAWVSTIRPGMDVTQLFQLMRGSATDISPPGRDNNTGYGLLNIPAALAAPIPPSDPQEPNDDVFAVKANGLFKTAKPFLIQPGKLSAKLSATMDYAEDPEDVYRIVVPAHRTVTVTMAPKADLSLGLWGPKTRTVFESPTNLSSAFKRDFLTSSTHRGIAAEKVVYRNKLGSAQQLYVDVWIGKGLTAVRNASYALSVVAR